jgi:hypothetical protein
VLKPTSGKSVKNTPVRRVCGNDRGEDHYRGEQSRSKKVTTEESGRRKREGKGEKREIPLIEPPSLPV